MNNHGDARQRDASTGDAPADSASRCRLRGRCRGLLLRKGNNAEKGARRQGEREFREKPFHGFMPAAVRPGDAAVERKGREGCKEILLTLRPLRLPGVARSRPSSEGWTSAFDRDVL